MTQQTVTTSGAGTFTVPDGVTSLTIEAWGAGGSGGGAGSSVADGGGGGGYSLAIVAVTAGQTVFYNVGAGPAGAHSGGNTGGTSWVNPSANSQPASGGVVAAGGTGGADPSPGGAGSVGTTNFTGGQGATQTVGAGGGGGGGAGSARDGLDGVAGGNGGNGGNPDGGHGGGGVFDGPAFNGTQPGGGGGGALNSGNGGNGADGQVRFTWTAIFNVGTSTNLTNVPAKAFTRKHYEDLLGEIRDEAIAQNQLLDGLSDKDRADLDFDVARLEFEELENSLGPTNYAKAMDAKEKLEKARRTRDHHYFMEIVNKEWAKYNESKKKQ